MLQARKFAAAYVTGGQSVADGAAAVGKSVTECRDWPRLPIVARSIEAIMGGRDCLPSFSLTDALEKCDQAYLLAKRKGNALGMLRAVDLIAKLCGQYDKDKPDKADRIDTLTQFLSEIAQQRAMPGRITNAQFEPKGTPVLPSPPTPPPAEVGIESHQTSLGSPTSPSELGGSGGNLGGNGVGSGENLGVEDLGSQSGPAASLLGRIVIGNEHLQNTGKSEDDVSTGVEGDYDFFGGEK